MRCSDLLTFASFSGRGSHFIHRAYPSALSALRAATRMSRASLRVCTTLSSHSEQWIIRWYYINTFPTHITCCIPHLKNDKKEESVSYFLLTPTTYSGTLSLPLALHSPFSLHSKRAILCCWSVCGAERGAFAMERNSVRWGDALNGALNRGPPLCPFT